MANVVLIFLLVFGGLFVVFTMMMLHELSKRGVKINYLFIKLLVIKYIQQYKQMTSEETGKVGPLYYPCILSINAALVLAVIYVVLAVFPF